MAIVSCVKREDSLYVTFGADVSIRNAARIRSALSKILTTGGKYFHLDLSEITTSDITFIQLLVAFNEKLKKQGGVMSLVTPVSGSDIMTLATECGVNLSDYFVLEDV